MITLHHSVQGFPWDRASALRFSDTAPYLICYIFLSTAIRELTLMTSHRGRLLIAVESEDLFRRIESQIASGSPAGRDLRAQHCLPEYLDSKLREYETDAVIVVQPRFHDDLPAAVRRWKTLRPDLQVLFFFQRIPNTRALVDLMRSGTFDVLHAEMETIGAQFVQEVMSNLQRRLDEVRIGSFERALARSSLADLGLIGESAETQNLFVQMLHAARLSCPVLISGEPGSGKRLVAHAVHALGPRASKQIVIVDCHSLSPALLCAALFGQSAFVAAERGTLLLNEISTMPHRVQTQLQRLLDAEDAAAHDVRLISTTTKRMDQFVETKSFLADLYYRLNTLPIDIPPLRRRLQDVPLLAQYFLSGIGQQGRNFTLSEEAADALCRYNWPGNVRELKAALETASARSVDGTILPAHLPKAVTSATRGPVAEEPFASSELNLARLERQAILRALQVSAFDKAKTARLLGIGKTSIYRKLKEMSGKPRP
jgi:two-component system response regulator HydG